MPSLKLLLRAVGVAALSLAAVGCGGGSSTATTSPPLTKAQFINKASSICRKASATKEQRLAATLEKDGKAILEASPEEFESLAVEVVFPLYGDAISELEELSPPAGDQALVSKILDEYNAALAKAEADPSLILKQSPFEGANEAAGGYGLVTCVF